MDFRDFKVVGDGKGLLRAIEGARCQAAGLAAAAQQAAGLAAVVARTFEVARLHSDRFAEVATSARCNREVLARLARPCRLGGR